MKKITIGLKEIVLIFIGVFISAIFMPISNVISQGTINLFNSVSTLFSDFYYTSLALHDPNTVNYYIISYIVSIIVMCFGAVYLYFSDLLTTQKNRINTLTLNINNIISDAKTEPTDPSKIKQDLITINAIHLKSEKLYSVLMILFMTFIVFIYINYSYITYVSSENAKFNNKLIVITPYVENQEILKIKSDWVRMRNINDYNKIQDKIKLVYKSIEIRN